MLRFCYILWYHELEVERVSQLQTYLYANLRKRIKNTTGTRSIE